jgi:hypothetical protein
MAGGRECVVMVQAIWFAGLSSGRIDRGYTEA